MRSPYVLALIALCSLTLRAADNITPLKVKEGLWEVTVTHSMTGMPSAPNIPPETLAKMPPDQRARLEAMMKGTPSTDVRKDCVTKEKLAKNAAFSANRGECTHTVISSTSSRLEMKVHCEETKGSSDSTAVIEALASDNVKSTIHSVVNGSNRTMNMDITITSKYLGADCGDVK
jgi:Protein of unknown function (DUF3617)